MLQEAHSWNTLHENNCGKKYRKESGTKWQTQKFVPAMFPFYWPPNRRNWILNTFWLAAFNRPIHNSGAQRTFPTKRRVVCTRMSRGDPLFTMKDVFRHNVICKRWIHAHDLRMSTRKPSNAIGIPPWTSCTNHLTIMRAVKRREHLVSFTTI